jgi:hypothetical protein
MNKYLTDHATKNVWCHIDQDRQAILKPARLTRKEGALNKLNLYFQTFKMPEINVRCHLYHIGRVFPNLLNIEKYKRTWTSFAQACMDGNTIFDIYTASGIQISKFKSYYLVTDDDNLVMCIVQDKAMHYNFQDDEIFLRTYDNVFFASNGFIDPVDGSSLGIEVKGGKMNTSAQAANLIDTAATYATKPGRVCYMHNGHVVYNFNMAKFLPGDILEFVYDPSIYKVVDFTLSQLAVFDSTMDTCGKYVLHYPATNSYDAHYIDYMDDIDVFIMDPILGNGVYCHKNEYNSMRMLTHRDYSIPVYRIADFIEKNKEYIKLRNAVVRLHIRHSRTTKPLQPINNMLRQLYKLPDTMIVGAMVGVNANVDIWRADALEQSAYTGFMSLKYKDITPDKTLKLYGYYGSSVIAGESPLPVVQFNTLPIVSATIAYQYGAKAYEYDQNGLLINTSFANNHPGGEIYNVVSSDAKLVELQLYDVNLDPIWKKSDSIDEYLNLDNVTIDPKYDWRMYVLKIGTASGYGIWEDVTGSSKYSINGNTLKWNVDLSLNEVCVRSNKKAIGAVAQFNVTNGVQFFNLDAKSNNTDSATKMRIPMGYLDVFLNGYSLIEGIDYKVNFPVVCVYNKKYLKDTDNVLAWRYYGHCTAQMRPQPLGDIGFVKNNNLSVNRYFNIRDDKLLRITVGGKLKTRANLIFAENSDYIFIDANNGLPYQVREELICIKGLYPNSIVDTYDELKKSRDVTKKIEDYLTVQLPEVPPTTENPIQSYYAVYSPFISKLTSVLLSGGITPTGMDKPLDNDDVREFVKPYLYVYAYDPNNTAVGYDSKYVQVRPHHLNTEVAFTPAQYRFIDRVRKLYAPNMQISNHYTVSGA